jgi:hypothetical protein
MPGSSAAIYAKIKGADKEIALRIIREALKAQDDQ